MKKPHHVREVLLAMFLLISIANAESVYAASAKSGAAERTKLEEMGGQKSIGISPSETVSFR